MIVKWFVNEEHSEQALQIRDDYMDQKVRILTPMVTSYEVLNALRYSGGFGVEELVKVSRTLDGYQFVEVQLSGHYSEETLRLAIEYGITVYDACYLAIGKLRGTEVYTADESLLRKAEKLEFVRHVKEYTPAASE